MFMNPKLAAAIALALLAAPAFAAPTVNNTLYLAGATAPDRTLFEAMVDTTNGVCDTTNPINVYTKTDLASYANWTVACTVRTGTLLGTEIAVAKSSSGSDYGIDPVANGVSALNGTNITFANTASGTCVAASVVADNANSRLAYTLNTACGSTAATVPQVGVSDVEPALFNASTTVRARLTNNGAMTTAFAPVVSLNLYRALQTAQGINTTTCTTGIATQTEACMPNLTTAQVRALLSQNVFDASSQILVNGTALTSATLPTGSTVTDVNVLICRRADTSGTQKSFERMFFGQNCGGRTPSLVFAIDATATQGGLGVTNCKTVGCTVAAGASPMLAAPNYVHQAAGSGDVEYCLDYANDNGIAAIGTLSTDRVPNDGTKQFRYVKVDGVAPSVENVMAQKWTYTTENVFLNPTGNSPNLTAYNTGNRSIIFSTYLLDQLRNATNVAKTHTTGNNFGRTGLTIRPSATSASLGTDTASVRPVTPFIRALSRSGSPVNNCAENVVAAEDVVKF